MPITFRFGETNGVVERLKGDTFVPVPVAEPRLVVGGPTYYDDDESCPELSNVNRLRQLELPEIQIKGSAFSNALSFITKIIHREDKEVQDPIEFKSWAQRTPDLTIPVTNAMGALLFFCDLIGDNEREVYKKLGKECPHRPVSFHMRDNEIIFIGPDWDYDEPVYRFYSMPNSFFDMFVKEEWLEEYLLLTLEKNTFKLRDDFSVKLVPFNKSVRIRARVKVHDDFCEKVVDPFWNKSLKTEKFSHLMFKESGKSVLYLRGHSYEGVFSGVWRYDALKIKDGSLSDSFTFCELNNGMKNEFVVGPASYLVNAGGDSEFVNECFVLRSNDGLVTRLDGIKGQVVQIQKPLIPLFRANAEYNAYTNTLNLLKRVVLPEFRFMDGPVTNSLALIQQTQLSWSRRKWLCVNPVGVCCTLFLLDYVSI